VDVFQEGIKAGFIDGLRQFVHVSIIEVCPAFPPYSSNS
jgi:hypothetical protein